MANLKYCMSSYLALRYVKEENKNFFDGLHHKNIPPIPAEEKTAVSTAEQIDQAIAAEIDRLTNEKIGLLLSGGMDSAILASYLKGCDAYTFRFLGGSYQKEELQRAEYFARCYDMKLHYVDIDWTSLLENLDPVIDQKQAPVHSIEPQIMQAVLQAKKDGITMMVIGNASDYVFGGMDQLLSKDWTYDAFVKRYCYLDPAEILNEAESVNHLCEPYRKGNAIDYQAFMADVAIEESYSSYYNAFAAAKMPYCDPYMKLQMAQPLDLARVRSGESKYLIRQLFAQKYPGYRIPDKNPMPRPVEQYFAQWKGPVRPEFRSDLDMSRFTGNQKWLMWCLEYFLNRYDEKNQEGTR